MDFLKIKDYPNRVAGVFKRFPLAVFFAAFSAATFIAINTIGDGLYNSIVKGSNSVGQWFLFFPMGAMFLSLTVALFYEQRRPGSSRVKLSIAELAVAAGWGALCAVLVYFYDKDDGLLYAVNTCYVAILSALFVVPFYKRKDDMDLLFFAMDFIKFLLISATASLVVTGVLCGLVLCALYLFGITSSHSTVYENILLFSMSFMTPVLTFAALPEVDEKREGYELGIAVTVLVKVFLTPVVLLFTLFMYADILKLAIVRTGLNDVAGFATGAVFSAIALLVLLYPICIGNQSEFSKKVFRGLPVAIIPLLVVIVIDDVLDLSKAREHIDGLYRLLFCLWSFVAIAIVLFNRKKCIRWMMLSFGVLFLVASVGPQRLYQVAKLFPQYESEIGCDCDKEEKLQTKRKVNIGLSFINEPVPIPEGFQKVYHVNKYNSFGSEFGKSVFMTDSTVVFLVFGGSSSGELARFEIPLDALEELAKDEGNIHMSRKNPPPFFENDSAGISITDIGLSYRPNSKSSSLVGTLFLR